MRAARAIVAASAVIAAAVFLYLYCTGGAARGAESRRVAEAEPRTAEAASAPASAEGRGGGRRLLPPRYGTGRAPRLQLIVRDEAGAPLEGVQIFRAARAAADVFTTDASGRAAVEYVQIFEPTECYFFAKTGFATEAVSLAPAFTRAGDDESPCEQAVVMRRGAEARGTVVDPDGRAIAGADVAVRPAEAAGDLAERTTLRAKSDASGLFIIANAHAGMVRVAVAAPGFAPFAGSMRWSGTPRIELKRAVTVRVQAVDAGGRPAAGAMIQFTARVDPDSRIVTPERATPAGADGIAAFDTIPAEAASVRFSGEAPGFVPAAADVPRERLAAPEPVVLRFAAPAAVVEGRVETESGEPLTGTVVSASWLESIRGFGDIRFAETDRDGRFRFDAFPAGADASLSFRWSPRGSAVTVTGLGKTPQFRVAPGEHKNIAVTVAARPVVVHVAMKSGRPAAAAGIHVEPVYADDAIVMHGAGDGVECHGLTDAAGDAELLLAEGRYRASVRHGDRVIAAEPLVVNAGTDAIKMIIDDLYELRGVLADAKGAPVARRRVEALFDAGSSTALTAADGAFVLPLLPAGAVKLRATGDRGELNGAESAASVPPSAPVRMILQTSDASGSVADDDTGVGAAAVVYFRKNGDPPGHPAANAQAVWSVQTDAEGKFTIPALSAGEWRLIATAPHYTAATSAYTVGPDAPPIRIRIVRECFLVLADLPKPKDAADKISIRLEPARPGADAPKRQFSAAWSEKTAPVGPFAAGEYKLEVEAGDCVRTRNYVAVPGATATISFIDAEWK